MSRQESTSIVESFKNYSRGYLAEQSKKLWLPTEIVYADSDLTSFNGYVKNMESNSWFLMKHLRDFRKDFFELEFVFHKYIASPGIAVI